MSFKDSKGSDGCRLHIWATDHVTAECRVIQNQVNNMRAQWDAQHNDTKRQKTNHSKPKQGYDLHVLLDSYNKAKDHLEKEIKQQQMACGKRKMVSFADEMDTTEEKADEKDSDLEWEQLTLTDVSEEELNELVLGNLDE
jgi:hypothetical protein